MTFGQEGAELLHADGQTDMTMLRSALHNFANASKNLSIKAVNKNHRCFEVCHLRCVVYRCVIPVVLYTGVSSPLCCIQVSSLLCCIQVCHPRCVVYRCVIPVVLYTGVPSPLCCIQVCHPRCVLNHNVENEFHTPQNGQDPPCLGAHTHEPIHHAHQEAKQDTTLQSTTDNQLD
jgi:hypothetical protein